MRREALTPLEFTMRSWTRAILLMSSLVFLACGGVVGELTGGSAAEAELATVRQELQDAQSRLTATQEAADATRLALAAAEAKLATCTCPEGELAATPGAETTATTTATTATTATTTTTASPSAAKTSATTTTTATRSTAPESGASTSAETAAQEAAAKEAAAKEAAAKEAAARNNGQIEVRADSGVRVLVDGQSVPYSKLKNAFIAKDLAPGPHTVELRSREENLNLRQSVEVTSGKRVRFELEKGKLSAMSTVDATN